MTPPIAIVLAAGEGRRMGGPKALLLVDGEPLLLRHVRRLREAGCGPIVVVARGSNAGLMRQLLSAFSGVQVRRADTASMAGSLRVALGCVALRSGRSVVVSPVDVLPARVSTLHSLLHAVTLPDLLVATPRYRAQGGHPVVARDRLFQTFLDGRGGTLRDLLRNVEAQRCRVDVDDPAVVSALDTPADLAAHRPGLAPQFARPIAADASA
ncbi:MAG TPA: NTP transferase domain-containing protein [Polyangiaceae bacterium]|nr:NTP transferase domain-containing protein [Polyangiaceae bacterium]